jgi:hypothetical protein
MYEGAGEGKNINGFQTKGKGKDSMAKDKGRPAQGEKREMTREEEALLSQRWAEASNWNPDDFETHPARRKFIAGKEPIPPRQG